MQKLKLEDLNQIRSDMQKKMDVNLSAYRVKVIVHMGTCGLSAGAGPVMEALKDELDNAGVDDVELVSSGCPGLCSQEPMVTVECENESPVKYVYVDAPKARTIFREHVLAGNIPRKFALSTGKENEA